MILKDNMAIKLHKSTLCGSIYNNSKRGVLYDNKITRYEMEVT